MNKKEKKVLAKPSKKTPKKEVKRIPTDVKENKIDFFVKKSDELAEKEAAKRRERKRNKVEFVNGATINVDEYVSETYADKETHYFKVFYNLIADLMGVSHDVMKNFVKPRIVALLKRKFIWGRFPNAVQSKIYAKNKYTGYCTRDYWNYQLLTKKADKLCFDYIKEFEVTAVEVLENGGKLKEFIIAHSAKCRLPLQLDAFDIFEEK